jgi:general secretion pathway protein B
MSFILDALKKSESDRQRKNRPKSAHIPTSAGESSSSRWLLLFGALLLINVVVLLVVLLKPEQANVDPLLPTIADTEEVEKSDSFRDLVANARDRQTHSPATDDAVRTPVPTTTAPAISQAAGIPAPVTTGPAINRESTAMQPPAPSTSGFPYKTFNEARADGSVQLPDLHLDLHVFDGRPGDRFVFINMNKYGENATLSEGPLVAEIVPDGVILEYLGTRFLLPRE